jgi:glycosyltransferase involved in cell wall biosynthesis
MRDEQAPLVSVVLATYNSDERYLITAVESILQQTYRDLELILIDDASTDGTWELLEQLARGDHRIRLLRNERNLRQGLSFNRAILAARGHYIAIMDHDDICALERIEKQVAYLEEHPEVGVVGCLTEALDEATGTRRPSSARTDGSWLDAAIVMVHPTMLVRRDLYARHGFYDNRYDDANDYEIQSRFASRGVRMHVLDERLFTYRVHPGSVTARRRRQVVGTSLRISVRTVLSYRRMLTARGWRSVARDAAIFVYLSLGLRHIVPNEVGKRLWPPETIAGL